MNKVIISLLAGLVVGVLIAPAKGAVTRKKLNDGFDNLSDSLDELIDRFRTKEDQIADGISGIAKMSDAV